MPSFLPLTRFLAVVNDEELSKFYMLRRGGRGSCHILGGGVLPNIHSHMVRRAEEIEPSMLDMNVEGGYRDDPEAARAALISTGLRGVGDICGDMHLLCVW
jgi:hypothetical protein